MVACFRTGTTHRRIFSNRNACRLYGRQFGRSGDKRDVLSVYGNALRRTLLAGSMDRAVNLRLHADSKLAGPIRGHHYTFGTQPLLSLDHRAYDPSETPGSSPGFHFDSPRAFRSAASRAFAAALSACHLASLYFHASLADPVVAAIS